MFRDMARDRFIDIEVENEDEIRRAILRMENRQQRQLREIVNDLTNMAAISVIAHAPFHSGYLINHIDRDGPQWFPGGAGGGGEWKSIVGIKAGSSQHPLYVEFGTGIYAGRGLIFPTGVSRLSGRYQPVMVFEKKGERPIYRYWIYGQKPQRYFYRAWLAFMAASKMHMMKEKLF